MKIQNFSFTKMHLKISSAKWWPFCPGGDEIGLQRQSVLGLGLWHCSKVIIPMPNGISNVILPMKDQLVDEYLGWAWHEVMLTVFTLSHNGIYLNFSFSGKVQLFSFLTLSILNITMNEINICSAIDISHYSHHVYITSAMSYKNIERHTVDTIVSQPIMHCTVHCDIISSKVHCDVINKMPTGWLRHGVDVWD